MRHLIPVKAKGLLYNVRFNWGISLDRVFVEHRMACRFHSRYVRVVHATNLLAPESDHNRVMYTYPTDAKVRSKVERDSLKAPPLEGSGWTARPRDTNKSQRCQQDKTMPKIAGRIIDKHTGEAVEARVQALSVEGRFLHPQNAI